MCDKSLENSCIMNKLLNPKCCLHKVSQILRREDSCIWLRTTEKVAVTKYVMLKIRTYFSVAIDMKELRKHTLTCK